MDKINNPFTPGAGFMPPELAGRQSAISMTRRSLIRKGMIYAPQHGTLTYTVPMFADYLRRVMPNLSL